MATTDSSIPQLELSHAEPDNPLRHYAGVLRRRSRWTIISVLVGLVLGLASSFFIKPAKITTRYYKAVNTLVVTADAQGNNGYSLDRAALLIQDKSLLDTVGKKVGWPRTKTGNHLAAQVRAGAYAIDVIGIATDANTAVTLANSAAAKLSAMADVASQASFLSQIQTLDSQRDSLQKQIQSMSNDPKQAAQLTAAQSQLATLDSQIAALGTSTQKLGLTTATPATAIEINKKGFNKRLNDAINLAGQLQQGTATVTPDATIDETDLSRPAVPGRMELILIGGFAGFVIGILLSFAVEAWDDRIRSRERVEQLCDLPVLAEIPYLTNEESSTNAVAMVDSPKSPTAERYRATCTATLFAIGETATERPEEGAPEQQSAIRVKKGHAPVILVTSPGPGEGKTTTSANLAAAFADTGRKVLAVDADYRRPALAKFLSPVPSLIDPDGPSSTRMDNVSFLSAPVAHSEVGGAVLHLRQLIGHYQNDFDVVIVDTPPMLTTNDATDLLAAADVAILVVRAGRTRNAAAQRAATVLSRLRADVLGVVLNGCDRKEMENYYGYGYGYGSSYGYGYYGSSSNKDNKKGKLKAAIGKND